METLVATPTIQLTRTNDGTLRVGQTRVSLDSVVHHFKLGATAEEIAQKFPALKLSEIYAAISYYLENRAEVEDYLLKQESAADEIQARIESAPDYQRNINNLRERLLERWAERKK